LSSIGAYLKICSKTKGSEIVDVIKYNCYTVMNYEEM
jgi:hypothetical protein